VSAGASTPDVLHIHIDGASRGNPGEAGFGVHVAGPDGTELARLFGYLGRTTNNVAEYQALLHALRWAIDHGARRIRIFSDSELLVRQVEGSYRVRHPGLVPLHREALALLERLEAELRHVPREENRDADRLANQAVDQKASKLE
jgi:ribonuclease HI